VVTPLCDRCGYDEIDPDATVADFAADRYEALCTECANRLHHLQARED
jgi:hypothetical protein